MPPKFFTNFWRILIEIAKSIDGEENRERVAGAYTILLNYIYSQFLNQQESPELVKINVNPRLTQNLMQFAKNYNWDLNGQAKNPPSSHNVVTPDILDIVLQEYVNHTQEGLPHDLDLVKNLPFQGDPQKARGRKFAGSFFTPPNLAQFLTQKVITNYLDMECGHHTSITTVLDPSMGSGIFLAEAAGILFQQLTTDFPRKSKSDILKKILNNHLFGMDILSEAVQTAKIRLKLWAAAQVSPSDQLAFMGEIDFKQHLLCIDTLTVSVENLLRTFGCKSFPVIIGNPPFLHTRTGLIDKKYKKQLQDLFSDIARGQWDLCTLFIRRIGDLLDPNGHWGFVLPTRLLSNEHYEPIRQWILQKFHIRSLVDAGMVFPDAGVEVFLLIASHNTLEVAPVSFEKFDGLSSEKLGQMDCKDARQFPFYTIPWLPQEVTLQLVLKIGKQARRLGDIVTITRGFECGFNDPSIGTIDILTQRGYGRSNLIPVIKGTNIHRFRILPSVSPTFCAPDWARSGKYKTPDIFFKVPKIVIRFVANEVIAAIDEIGYADTNGVYNLHPRLPIQPVDLWWVLVLLNSAPVNFWFKHVFANRDKLYPHIQKNQLEAIPIPLLTIRETQILTYLSKTLQDSSESKNGTFVQEYLLDPLCVAQYLHDDILVTLLDEMETLFFHNKVSIEHISRSKILSLVTEIKREFAPVFE